MKLEKILQINWREIVRKTSFVIACASSAMGVYYAIKAFTPQNDQDKQNNVTYQASTLELIGDDVKRFQMIANSCLRYDLQVNGVPDKETLSVASKISNSESLTKEYSGFAKTFTVENGQGYCNERK
jgi:hypothetical protein